MTMQGPSKSVSEIVGRIAEALDAHLGSAAWRGNASVGFDPATKRLTFTDNGGAVTVLDLSGLVPEAQPEALTAIAYSAETKRLIYTAEDARTTSIDLSGLGSDVHISGGSYDPETMRLTLKDSSDETPDIIIDFSGLVVHMATNADGTTTLTDGRGLIGNIDTRRKIEVVEHHTGDLWVNGQPIMRSIFDLSAAMDGSLLLEGVSLMVRQCGLCSDGTTEYPSPQDHDGNTFQAVRDIASGTVQLQRAGNYAVPRPGEFLMVEFLRPLAA